MSAAFFRRESAPGILLMAATVCALLVANSPLAPVYAYLIEMPVAVQIDQLVIHKPLLLWINDGLMAVFFFVVGLELKREICEGALSQPQQVWLPASGAVGGMLVPASIYVYINLGDNAALAGWAIPAATDIAFALGILVLLGPRVPPALKLFLVTLAIIDDIGAIAIIALVYSNQLSLSALGIAALCLFVLGIMNYRGTARVASYLLIGVILWTALLKSGVHATLAGVLLAFFIPMRATSKASAQHADPLFQKDASVNEEQANEIVPQQVSPVLALEHDLQPAVNFVILPVFAFANAGIYLLDLSTDAFLHPVTLGTMLGLLVGKPVGVMLFCAIAVRLGLARIPPSLNWNMLFGAALLCGVGFTMSLFIGSLAFEETGTNLLFDERLGILSGSFLSAVLGYTWLRRFSQVDRG